MSQPDPEWNPDEQELQAIQPQATALETAIHGEQVSGENWSDVQTVDWTEEAPKELEERTTEAEASQIASRRNAQARYFAAIVTTASPLVARRHVGVPERTLHGWRQQPWFADAERRAIEQAGEYLVANAMQMACEGTLEPVFQGGRCVGYVRKKSEKVLIELLRAFSKEKFGKAAAQHLHVSVPMATPEQLADAVRKLSPTLRREKSVEQPALSCQTVMQDPKSTDLQRRD